MTDVRYLGSSHWTRTHVDDEGKFKRQEKIAPGEVFSADDELAERLLQGPKWLRIFVQAGGPEDPNSDEYVAKRDIGEGGNYVSDDPALEMGSTVTGKAVFVTDDENPNNYPVAKPEEGWASDNEALVQEDEIRAEADKAREKARESRSTSKSSSSGKSSTSGADSSDTSGRSRPSPQGRESREGRESTSS